MTKQRTGYPVIDEILESIAPLNVSEEDWHVENNERFQPGQIVVSESGLVVAHVYIHEEAALIVREHNAHRKLVTALERVETKSRNQTRSKSDAVDTLLEIGDIARAALALAEVQR